MFAQFARGANFRFIFPKNSGTFKTLHQHTHNVVSSRTRSRRRDRHYSQRSCNRAQSSARLSRSLHQHTARRQRCPGVYSYPASKAELTLMNSRSNIMAGK